MKGRVIIFSFLTVLAAFTCRNSSNKTGEFVFPLADSVPMAEIEKLNANKYE